MEPHDLKPNPPPDDAHLDTWLRTHAALPPLPDDGLTRRVLADLPAPTARRSSQRTWVCVTGALVGVAVAGLQVASAPERWHHLPRLMPETARALAQLADPRLGVAAIITLTSLAYVFWPDLRRRLRIR